MRAYYNEFNPKAAAWLRELIKEHLIMDGDVDERSIVDVSPNDLKGYTRHHFFAGIAGWERALQIAGWQPDRPVCTASLPCQPFSDSGARKGKNDERHLLPYFINLVRECRFDILLGEQVPAAIRYGWLDDLYTEMEQEGYTVGSTVLTAAGAGAPHVRQRLYWVACRKPSSCSRDRKLRTMFEQSFAGSRVGYPYDDGYDDSQIASSDVSTMHREPRKQELSVQLKGTSQCNDAESLSRCKAGFTEWYNPIWLHCRDGKYRPTKSSISTVVNGLPKGMGYSSDTGEPIDADNTQEAYAMRLKGYGNAIVPFTAAQFISVFLDYCFEDNLC